MAKERIAWHPAFASVVQIDLGRYGGQLEYETEHELNLMPLRIDLVVVRKDPALFIERGYASAFRGHNLMEFKSENDTHYPERPVQGSCLRLPVTRRMARAWGPCPMTM